MISTWSQLEQVWRDLLIHMAQGAAFRRLSKWHKFTYQYGLQESSWRRALLELAWGKKGTRSVTFDVLRHLFRQYDTVFEVEVDPSNPTELVFVSSDGLTEFDRTHVGRYIETPWGRVWSSGPVLCGGTSTTTSSTLQLSPYATQFWQAPAWPFTTPTRFTVRMLPFLYYEMQRGPVNREVYPTVYHPGDPCLIDVYFIGSTIPGTPTTYLQEAGVPTPSDVPFGGNLLDDEFQQGDPLGDGPHPLYLVDDRAFEAVRSQVQRTLVAGVEIRFHRLAVAACQESPPPSWETIIML